MREDEGPTISGSGSTEDVGKVFAGEDGVGLEVRLSPFLQC